MALEKKSAYEVSSELDKLQNKYKLQSNADDKIFIKRDIQVILSETFIGD